MHHETLEIQRFQPIHVVLSKRNPWESESKKRLI
nr:MAG TPA: hypothetical protein [Caudoviricetes sp.]